MSRYSYSKSFKVKQLYPSRFDTYITDKEIEELINNSPIMKRVIVREQHDIIDRVGLLRRIRKTKTFYKQHMNAEITIDDIIKLIETY